MLKIVLTPTPVMFKLTDSLDYKTLVGKIH